MKSLSEALRNHKSCMAWLDLDTSERRLGSPPALLMDADLTADLRNEQSHFMSLALKVRELLNQRPANAKNAKQRARWRRQLLELEREFNALKLPQSF